MPGANPFAAPETAAVYDRGRPRHHARTVDRILRLAQVARLPRVLDVGAGTGASMLALGGRAATVVGIDSVEAMLSIAKGRVNGPLAVAHAEAMPFRRAAFDAITVGSAVHWFDQERFFEEARRLLQPGGFVAVYEHAFTGELDGERGFATWMRDGYSVRFPSQVRGGLLGPESLAPLGFTKAASDTWSESLPLDHRGLVDYFLSQSNTLAAVDSGETDRDAVRRWLTSETARWFVVDVPRPFRFLAWAVLYRPWS